MREAQKQRDVKDAVREAQKQRDAKVAARARTTAADRRGNDYGGYVGPYPGVPTEPRVLRGLRSNVAVV